MYKNSEGQNVDMLQIVKIIEKVLVVLNVLVLKNVLEFIVFLGLIDYYGCFMENLLFDFVLMYNFLKDD